MWIDVLTVHESFSKLLAHVVTLHRITPQPSELLRLALFAYCRGFLRLPAVTSLHVEKEAM
jgi:hypothetical protein